MWWYSALFDSKLLAWFIGRIIHTRFPKQNIRFLMCAGNIAKIETSKI